MDQRQYSPPNKEKGDHSKEIESKSHSTPARKIQENVFRSQTITSRKPRELFLFDQRQLRKQPKTLLVSDETEVKKMQYPRLHLYACTIQLCRPS
jgi:hypothetical protein